LHHAPVELLHGGERPLRPGLPGDPRGVLEDAPEEVDELVAAELVDALEAARQLGVGGHRWPSIWDTGYTYDSMVRMMRTLVDGRGGRVAQLLVGLGVLAFGEVMIIKAHLGVIPWDVLNQGLVHRFGLTIGQWSMIVGGVVLLLWIPLRERPGMGTVT